MKRLSLLALFALTITSCSYLMDSSSNDFSSTSEQSSIHQDSSSTNDSDNSLISSGQSSSDIISSESTTISSSNSESSIVSSSSFSSSSIVEIPPVNPNIIFTEMNTGTSFVNRALEISNISDEDASLDHFAVHVYRNWSEEYTETIPLDGYIIKAKSCFVIAYHMAKQEILDKADLVTDQYLNDGTFPVSLSFYDEIVDTIGHIGYVYDFAKAAVLVRLKEYFKQSKSFKDLHWIRYPVNSLDTLGNYDVVSEETLQEGPKLSEEFYNSPFCDNATNGNGGVLEVTYLYNIDGDTTKFNYGSLYSAYDISGSLSTRYYGINTPEIAHGSGEEPDPYGDEAKDFTTRMLKNAKHYLVQSVNGYSLHETYGRMLCYVWISTKDNPEISDYQLLNYLIVKNGFSHPGFIDRQAEYNSLMTHEGVSYVEYLYYADTYAEALGLNIHSK